ncbi:hypothetical protein PHLGIDRAFT_125533 [Phlebiopsis gigantea 11061_1 CR5-6]|uniref:Uncharacterized protein n=1 Tax=Phlebiopsis gigantea (strain 11061_1 CR5-6) TaxID=745531 RepID=A0A0C3PSU6_PHLG1|nr:hypothetical protein PHLGIDRAFT_125533 [Phlebiopsis gigantea 11061_1 CR5-6]
MSSQNTSNTAPSQPIPINPRRGRAESVSDTSSESSASPVSPTQSPLSSMAQPRIASPTSTPILSYLLSQSPKSPTNATYPFRRGFGPTVFEDDSDPDLATPKQHARRASTVVWPGAERAAPPAQSAAAPTQEDRAAGLLRRLSLGGTALRPILPQIRTAAPTAPSERVPPNSPVVERGARMAAAARKSRRATMAAGTARPKRAPSPMGERILTGHFDGFN